MLKLNKKQYTSLIVSFYLIITPAYALPTGAKVVHGDVKFKINKNTMQIRASDKSIINYNTFNINSKETVSFIQPSSNSVVLNRVITANPSSILGTLNANGRVFLINPAGIIFGKTASINVNSLVATTLNISDKDFLNSNYKFTQLKNMPKAYILQNGNINISDNGFIVLTAPFIKNDGVIIAKSGNINIGAVDNFYLNFDGNDLVMFSYKPSVSNNKDIILSKTAANDIIQNVINSSEKQQKLKIVKENGVIKLVGGSGNAVIKGKLIANSAKNKQAGKINIVAQTLIDLTNLNVLANTLKGDGGKIYIFSDGDTFTNSNVLLSAKSSNGNGGFIELSAKNNVIMNGLDVDTSSINGTNGVFYVDPKNISIQQDIFYKTNPLFEASDTFTLEEGKTISSSKNTDISIFAPHITLEKNSKIHSGADLLLSTTTKDGEIKYKDVSIDIKDNVELTGNDITLNAVSNYEFLFNKNVISNPSFQNAAMFAIFSPISATLMETLPIVYWKGHATSNINIENAHITALKDININSSSTSKLDIDNSMILIAIAVGQNDSSSKINITDSTITAQQDININSTSKADTSTSANATNLFINQETSKIDKMKVNLAFAYSDTTQTSNIIIDNNSNLKATNNINIKADGYKNITTSAHAASYSEGIVGSAVSMSKSNSNIKVEVGGEVNAKNINLEANTYIDKLSSTSEASVGNELFSKLLLEKKFWIPNIIDKIPKLSTAISSVLENTINKINPVANSKGIDNSSTKFALSAAISYSQHQNDNKVSISKNANISALKDININSNIIYTTNGQINSNEDPNFVFGEYGIKTSAIATVSETKKYEKENSATGSVVLTDITNNSDAFIDDNAIVSSKENLNINSLISIKYNIDWENLFKDNSKTDNSSFFDSASKIYEKFMDIKDIKNLFTTFAQNSVDGNKLSVAGIYNNFKLTNNSHAYVAKNSTITTSNLNIVSKLDVDTINFAGVIAWLYFGNNSGNIGIGGSYLESTYNNDVKSYIDEGSNIKLTNLNINSIKNSGIFSLSTAGGKSNYAISGSISYLENNDKVKSYITTNNIEFNQNNNYITLNAENNSYIGNATGGVVAGKSVGIGVSVTKNDITRDTEAYINSMTNTPLIPLNVFNIYISLNSLNNGHIGAYSLAAAYSSSNPVPNTKPEEQQTKAGKFGLAISAESALNYINDTTKSYINNSYFMGILPSYPYIINIDSKNNTDFVGISGGFAFSNPSSSNGISAGLSGAYTANYLNNSTYSYIDNSNILDAESINLNSKNNGNSVILTASLSGGNSQLNLAGSVGINKTTNSAISYITNSYIRTKSSINLNSLNGMNIKNYAGGASISYYLPIGSAYTATTLKNTTNSYISNNNIYSENLNIISKENTQTDVVATAVAASTENMAVSASIVNTNIQNNINSYISKNKNITTSYLTLNSNDETTLKSVAGFINGSNSVGIGDSSIINNIDNTINSYIDSSNVYSNLLKINAISNKYLKDLVEGGEYSGTAGIAGGFISTEMADNIKSYISNSTINVNSMAINAIEENQLDDIAGFILATDSLGLGGSLNKNYIHNTISAYIDNSSNINLIGSNSIDIPDITQNDYSISENIYGLSVLALTDEHINLKSANGGGSGFLSANMSFNNSKIADTLNSYIDNSLINNDNKVFSPSLSILVRTASNDLLNIDSGAASISSGLGSIGSSITDIDIQNSTNAYISNSTLYTANKLEVSTNSKEQILAKTISGSVATLSEAGSISIINIHNKNNSNIIDSIIYSNNDIDVLSIDEALLGYEKTTQSNGDIPKGTYIENSMIIGATDATYKGVGIGAAILVNNVKNTSISTISNSNINAKGTFSLNSKNNVLISDNVLSGTLGAFTGAGNIIANDIYSTTQSLVQNNSKINLDKQYQSDNQNVLINAYDYNYIYNSTNSITIGIVGYGASIDLTNLKHNTKVNIESNSNIYANNNININSQSDNNFVDDITAYSVSAGGITGAVVIGNFMKNILDSDDDKKAYGNISSTLSNIIKTAQQKEGNKENDNIIKYLLGSNDEDIVEVVIGDSTNITALNTLSLNANTNYSNININAGSGGGVNFAAGVALAYIGGINQIIIGKDNILYANDLQLNSIYKLDNAKIKSFNGEFCSDLSIGADYTKATINYLNQINTDSNTNLIAKNNLNITSQSIENLQAIGNGLSFSNLYLSAGLSFSDINTNADTEISIGNSNKLFANNDLSIISQYSNNLNSYVKASAINPMSISLQGAISNVENYSTISTSISYSNLIEARNGSLNINNISNSLINSTSVGSKFAAASIGEVKATSTFNPTSTLTINSNSNLYGGNVNIENSINNNYNQDSSNVGVYSSAFATSGNLYGSVGAKSITNSSSDIETEIDGTSIYSLNDLNINTLNYLVTSSYSDGLSIGAASKGTTSTDLNIYYNVLSLDLIGSNLNANNQISVNNFNFESANSQANGGIGGILSQSGTQANINASNSTTMNIENSNITTKNNIFIKNIMDTELSSKSYDLSVSWITENDVASNIISDNDILTSITNSNIKTYLDIEIDSKINNMNIISDAYSKIDAAGGIGLASSSIKSNSDNIFNANLNISNTNFYGNDMSIDALQDNIIITSTSNSEISPSIAGYLKSYADNTANLSSNLNIDSSTFISSSVDHISNINIISSNIESNAKTSDASITGLLCKFFHICILTDKQANVTSNISYPTTGDINIQSAIPQIPTITNSSWWNPITTTNKNSNSINPIDIIPPKIINTHKEPIPYEINFINKKQIKTYSSLLVQYQYVVNLIKNKFKSIIYPLNIIPKNITLNQKIIKYSDIIGNSITQNKKSKQRKKNEKNHN